MSLGTGVLSTGILGTPGGGYDALGVGSILLSGLSDIESSASVVGVGSIEITGLSQTQWIPDHPGVGSVLITGTSTIESTPQAVGTGQILITGTGSVEIGIQKLPSFWVSTRYECYLGDLLLPLKSLQYRLNANQNFASLVVPGADAYADAINARLGELLTVRRIYVQSDGSEDSFLMFSVTFDSIRTDSGGKSGITGTLSGSDSYTGRSPQTIPIQNVTYQNATNGTQRRYRCELDPRVRPGDTVTTETDSFVVSEVVWYIDVNTSIIELAE